MSILANRMKGVAPSSQVTNLLSASFNVPSRGRKTIVGDAVQLRVSSGTVEGLGFGVHSGSPLVWIRDPSDSKTVLARITTDFKGFTWQRKLNSTDIPTDATNCLGVDTSGNPLTFTSDGCVSVNFSDGTNRGVKLPVSPTYSENAIKCTTTSNEAILNSWAISGSGTAVIQRFNTVTGSVTWGHQISSGEGPPFNQGMGIAESPDGSIISYGVRVQGTTQDSWTIRRVNFSNGGQIWHYKYYDSAFNSWEPVSMSESNANLIIGTNQRNLVALSKSDGSISWQKKMGAGSEYIHDIYWDSSLNYYYCSLRASNEIVVVNTSGTTQFTRQFSASNGSFRVRGIRTDSDWMYVFGVVSSAAYVIRLPKDGTGIEGSCTFSNGVIITYSATTLTESTPNWSRYSTNVGVSSSTGSSTTTIGNDASTVFSLNQQGI